MEWSDVRVFLAIARSGTLGGAARSLQTSHPTVGRRLRALEQAIGHTLFQRTADGLVLTEEGHGIIALAEQMEEGALAMQRRLAGQEQTLKGSLRIASPGWFGAYVLPPILAEFSNAYPNVDVAVLTGSRLSNLAQREADVAFRIVPFDTADIVQRRLFKLEYGVYIAEQAPDPKYGDGTGFRLITH
ncbi:MAG: LysR family transcriptional regulator, partial [Rhodospirillales bacterium]|nr:LysR family transcriptional regulator [Rhodospirillales bacterium]